MHYPNSIKKDFERQKVSHANRGMKLESLLNLSNDYYREINKAIIYKKPTPIRIVNTSTSSKGIKITDAYFESPSTLDYNGIYKGKYIDFDAKETKEKTRFPLQNLHDHQLLHMKKVIEHGGISFLIISINNLIYYLDGTKIIEFINTNKDKKSIPYKYIEENGFIIKQKINPRIDYLEIIDKLYFKE
jgi:recombination protein U